MWQVAKLGLNTSCQTLKSTPGPPRRAPPWETGPTMPQCNTRMESELVQETGPMDLGQAGCGVDLGSGAPSRSPALQLHLDIREAFAQAPPRPLHQSAQPCVF